MTDLEGPSESLVEIFSCKGTPPEKYSSRGYELGSHPAGPSRGRQKRSTSEPRARADWPAGHPPPPRWPQDAAFPQLLGPVCGTLLCLLNIIKNCLL